MFNKLVFLVLFLGCWVMMPHFVLADRIVVPPQNPPPNPQPNPQPNPATNTQPQVDNTWLQYNYQNFNLPIPNPVTPVQTNSGNLLHVLNDPFWLGWFFQNTDIPWQFLLSKEEQEELRQAMQNAPNVWGWAAPLDSPSPNTGSGELPPAKPSAVPDKPNINEGPGSPPINVLTNDRPGQGPPQISDVNVDSSGNLQVTLTGTQDKKNLALEEDKETRSKWINYLRLYGYEKLTLGQPPGNFFPLTKPIDGSASDAEVFLNKWLTEVRQETKPPKDSLAPVYNQLLKPTIPQKPSQHALTPSKPTPQQIPGWTTTWNGQTYTFPAITLNSNSLAIPLSKPATQPSSAPNPPIQVTILNKPGLTKNQQDLLAALEKQGLIPSSKWGSQPSPTTALGNLPEGWFFDLCFAVVQLERKIIEIKKGDNDLKYDTPFLILSIEGVKKQLEQKIEKIKAGDWTFGDIQNLLSELSLWVQVAASPPVSQTASSAPSGSNPSPYVKH